MHAHTPWTRTWDAVPGSLTAIRHAVTEFALAVGASRRTRDAVALAVSEAVSNSVIHGYLETEPGCILVTASLLDPDRLQIVVADDGSGLKPRLDSPGLGLGLPVIAELTDRVDFDGNGTPGTVVTMEFLRLT
jgi:anti-sigma regulatory factor (Ser/Thr protein kinase)